MSLNSYSHSGSVNASGSMQQHVKYVISDCVITALNCKRPVHINFVSITSTTAIIYSVLQQHYHDWWDLTTTLTNPSSRRTHENFIFKSMKTCLSTCCGSLMSLELGALGGHFKYAYEPLNLKAHKISVLYKNHIFQCMGKIFCVEFQRAPLKCPLKFHTKYLTTYIERCGYY